MIEFIKALFEPSLTEREYVDLSREIAKAHHDSAMRDDLAKEAMKSMMVSREWGEFITDEIAASFAYRVADAMMKAREESE